MLVTIKLAAEPAVSVILFSKTVYLCLSGKLEKMA